MEQRTDRAVGPTPPAVDVAEAVRSARPDDEVRERVDAPAVDVPERRP